MLEDTLGQCREQRATMKNLRRKLAPLNTAEQPDIISISEQVGTKAEVVARGLDGLGNGLDEMGQQLVQLTGRLDSWEHFLTTTWMPHGNLHHGSFRTVDADQSERVVTRFWDDWQAAREISEWGRACRTRGSMLFGEVNPSSNIIALSVPPTSIPVITTAINPSELNLCTST